MFDPVTIDLIGRAPPLGDLDFSELPQRFTNAFAEIVAARVRLRGVATLEQRGEAVIELLAEMRRLAAAQELLVATAPERADRASAALPRLSPPTARCASPASTRSMPIMTSARRCCS